MRRSTMVPCVITYAGIDYYHKKFSVVTMGEQAGKTVSTQRLSNDRYSIAKFYNSKRFRRFENQEHAQLS